ncbi:ATP-binding protein [Occallatibacter savannae]|uniref:ATP-binding protein n=1 Tax=Occallatibacter savannae TaxID=1002691 RepID=UPI000D690C24|nr:ATP-binding protein [Occallatibacter savannae]
MGEPRSGAVSALAFEYGLKPAGIAVVFVLVALLWTFPLQHLIDYPFVFLFFGAIMGSAWFGGSIAGVIAVVLSSLLVTYFFIPPFYSISVAAESQSFLAAFILFAITMSFVSSARKRAETQVKQARDLLETRVQERTAELEQSTREIQRSERELRLLTEAIPQQIWRADASGAIEYVNQNLREYLGSPEEKLLKEGLFRALDPRDAIVLRETWQQALETGTPLEVQARVLNAQKESRWFLIRAFPQSAENGRIVRWYGLHIDIEEHEREQQSLTARQERLSRISRDLSMSEIAVSIAHELNQPMTALLTHAYACREWAASTPPNLEKVSATAEKIVQESTRASAVVKRVRSLFSPDEPVRVATDLNRLIQDSARLLRDDAARHGVQMDLDLEDKLSDIEMDPIQIQQVILNLAKNSIEAMAGSRKERVVQLSTRAASEDEVLVIVSDTGPGIAPEIVANIFEPFFSTKKNGTGIGLAICRSIVEAHSGRISAYENKLGGATLQFTVRTRG